jgi:diguanylate cyclase
MVSRDHNYTFEIAQETLERIKALGLPADPASFELWYTYVTRVNEPLNRCINTIIQEKGSLSLEELERIETNFAPDLQASSAIGNASTKISCEVDHVIELLSELILSTAQGREDCAKASRKLVSASDRDAVRAISDTLVESLRSIELQHTALERQLVHAKAQVNAAIHALAMVTAQANLDSVTGIANRRAFDVALDRTVERARSGTTSFCLLMIDIDHFKAFNDHYGHLMGDTVLRLIGAMLRQSIRESDFAARYGGEEFAVILSDADSAAAVSVAEKIRTKIMGRQLKKRSTGETLGTITVSIGIAQYRSGDESRTIVERADARLYDAKHSGRNCTRYEADLEPLSRAG